ncbi:signal peptidase II [Chloracidobacterium sp. D]|uniref:signal peptidase II n=1 Tax=Chloracidobacterium sp. D TaxID=2821536 RepID=UPI001B8C9AE6|nr:signal peptidase II [Chloracidobacterium sp. D]QUV82156.1 signal peptidase II [Chloracidobacterium sp. D]
MTPVAVGASDAGHREPPYRHFLVAGGLVVLDQFSKLWVYWALRPTDAVIRVVPGFFHLRYAENPGIAFSLLDSGTPAMRLTLLVIAACAGVGVGLYLWWTPADRQLLRWTLTCLLGGILGNALDRIVHGAVIDFLDFHWGAWHFPTFNLADSCITVGAVMLALDTFSELWRPARTET